MGESRGVKALDLSGREWEWGPWLCEYQTKKKKKRKPSTWGLGPLSKFNLRPANYNFNIYIYERKRKSYSKRYWGFAETKYDIWYMIDPWRFVRCVIYMLASKASCTFNWGLNFHVSVPLPFIIFILIHLFQSTIGTHSPCSHVNSTHPQKLYIHIYITFQSIEKIIKNFQKELI